MTIFCTLELRSSAQADFSIEALSVGGELGIALPLTLPERRLFNPGATAGVSLRYAVLPWLHPEVRFATLILTDGKSPEDPNRIDPSLGTWTSLGLGVRCVLNGVLHGRAPAPHGLLRGAWLGFHVSGGMTGDALRAGLDVSGGWAFQRDTLSFGPVLRYMPIFQGADDLSSSDAHLLSLGVELAWTPKLPPVEAAAAVAAKPAPPRDSDEDGIIDTQDACPQAAEDKDGFEDEDGCPDVDDDQDGVFDEHDACRLEAEDFDDFEDEDGCPEPDNDGDGIEDLADECPDDAEIVNGVEDLDGCPDEGVIELKDERIILEERVLFDFERSRVKRGARPVLDAIVTLYRQQEDWAELRVEGHADLRGSDAYNLEISDIRARRVRAALVKAGIPEDMIHAVGLGRSQPRAEGEDEATHQKNRRVEFVIVARRPVTRPAPPVIADEPDLSFSEEELRDAE